MIQNYNQDLLSENLTFIQLPCKILFVVTRKSITLVMIKGREEVTVCTQKASHVISTQTLNWNSSFAIKWSGRDKTYFPNFSNFTMSFTLKKKTKTKKLLFLLFTKTNIGLHLITVTQYLIIAVIIDKVGEIATGFLLFNSITLQ